MFAYVSGTITTPCTHIGDMWFDFFFGLHLGERLYSHTYDLSKDPQGTKEVAAVSGRQCPANLTKETLKKMRTYQSFDHLYANVVRKSEGLLV